MTHSMGCNIAIAYHLAHPDHVAGNVFWAGNHGGKCMRRLLSQVLMISEVEIPSQCVVFYTNMGLDEVTASGSVKVARSCSS
jgi:alpha-beta hydrolase superfamily lysophospholipase